MRSFSDNKDKNYDEKLLEESGESYDFDTLCPLEGTKRFSIDYRNIRFECMFNRNMESKKLYVFLNSSRLGGSTIFHRWSWYSFIDGSMLNIDDPMYKEYEGLYTGFYYGTWDVNYRELVCDIAKKFVDIHGFEEVIFYGSSSGGSAAIQCACYLDGSKTIVINPQIKISIDNYCDEFCQITGMNPSDDHLGRDTILDHVANSNSKFVFVFNAASNRERPQLQYLSDFYGVSTDGRGIRKVSENCLLWNYDVDFGDYVLNHNAYDYDTIFWVLIELLNAFCKDEISERLLTDYSLISELWRDNAKQKLSLDNTKKKINESKINTYMKQIAGAAENIYILGMGKWGCALYEYCVSNNIPITGYAVTEEYLEESRKRTTASVKSIQELGAGDKLILASSENNMYNAVISSGLQFYMPPEWFMRKISGT